MHDKRCSIPLVLGALGVVYGDIGTSPLYAIRESLRHLLITQDNILGVLSLIFWSLVIVISIKYLIIVFRADNKGEGGVLALLALLKQKQTRYEYLFYLLAIFGTGLLVGDGMLTPAISVMSAIEGLKPLSPVFDELILPLSCGILLLLFVMQSKGTAKIGAAFGPVILIWFVTIAILGLTQIINNPVVLKAINPYYAYMFFCKNGLQGYFLLGGVFLVVTGGEALYADIGHFGKNPIRYSWFLVALPCILLNYFGQGANLITHPDQINNPFYLLSPDWFYIPLVIISTLATVIASQAVITATFSLTKQAMLLGLCPRFSVVQTSPKYVGQIYIPQMNFCLLMGTMLLIITFKSSSNMTHAYGIAVNLVMALVTIMIAYVASQIWKWSALRVALLFGIFLSVDLLFLGANAHKFLTGGWVPICFALIVAVIMYTWNRGIEYLKANVHMQKEDISKIIKQLNYKTLNHLPGVTAIFITDAYDRSGGSFLHFLKLSHSVPEHILILNYNVGNTPYVSDNERFAIHQLNEKIFEVTLSYGFMDTISIPDALDLANKNKLIPFEIKVTALTYLVEIPNIVASKKIRTQLFHWQEKIFAFLMRNYSANLNIEFYQLPYNRTIAIGTYCII